MRKAGPAFPAKEKQNVLSGIPYADMVPGAGLEPALRLREKGF